MFTILFKKNNFYNYRTTYGHKRNLQFRFKMVKKVSFEHLYKFQTIVFQSSIFLSQNAYLIPTIDFIKEQKHWSVKV